MMTDYLLCRLKKPVHMATKREMKIELAHMQFGVGTFFS
jgi:hypothetical protein